MDRGLCKVRSHPELWGLVWSLRLGPWESPAVAVSQSCHRWGWNAALHASSKTRILAQQAKTDRSPLLRFPIFLSGRAAPTRDTDSTATSRREDSSPDGSLSPPSAVAQALNFSPEKTGLTLSESISTEVVLDAAQPPGDTPTGEVRELPWTSGACPRRGPTQHGVPQSRSPGLGLSCSGPLGPAVPERGGEDLQPPAGTEATPLPCV